MTTDSAPGRLRRLLTLVPWLMRNDGVTIAEAAQHFQVSEQVLERDLWLLIVCGLPGYGPDQLVDIQFWDGGVIHVLDPLTLDRPLRLTSEEASSLLVALRMLAQIAPPTPALLSATQRLVTAAAGAIDPQGSPIVLIDDGTAADVLECLTQALQESRSVDISYAGGTRDDITTRTVEPLMLESIDGRTTMMAYCRMAGANRTFRVDRILTATLGDSRDVSDAPTAPSSVSSASAPVTCTLVLDPSARWATDVHGMRVVEDRADGSVVAQMDVHDPAWLVRLVLGLRGAAEVREPADVRQAVATAARTAMAALDANRPG